MRSAWVIVLVLVGLALGAPGCGDRTRPAPGNVLLVVVDTARRDHISAFGYLRDTTPNLDRLAREGQRFDEVWSQAPWTLPAIATLLTGQPPHVHGAMRGPRGIHPVADDVPTLAERLRQAGYATAAFINVLWCAPEVSALNRGFDHYDYSPSNETNQGQRDAAATTDAALGWLDTIGDAPFFAVVHYFDPHLTYDPPAPFDTQFDTGPGPHIPRGFGSAAQVFAIRDGKIRLSPAQRQSLIARYDGEIRYVDDQFGRLREGLEQRGRWNDTLVIVVADHGEEFWDHGGFEHGQNHFPELLHVPLILRRPGGPAGERFAGRARQLDVAPTILDFAGLDLPADLPGFVLGSRSAEYAVAEGSLWAGDLVSVRSDRGTVILDRDNGDAVFFEPDDVLDLRPEPVESDAARELLELLEALPPTATSSTTPRPLSEEQLERLRSLGYVE